MSDLIPGRFRNVPFLIRSSSISGGRRIIKHVFPGRDEQSIENLGKIVKPYRIQIVTRDNAERDALIRAFDLKEPGVLHHPYYGVINNVVVSDYTVNESLTAHLTATIDVTFEQSTTPTSLLPEGTQRSEIDAAVKSARQAIRSNVTDNFKATPTLLNTIRDASARINDIVNDVLTKSAVISRAADQIDTFTFQVNEIQRKVYELISKPQELANSIDNLFIAVRNLYSLPENAATVLTSFSTYGNDFVARIENTVSNIERNNNDRVLINTVKSLSLVNAYQSASETQFTLVQQIEQLSDTLEQHYISIDDVDSTVVTVRLLTQQYLETQKKTALDTVTVQTRPTTVRLLAFQYYGTDDRYDELLSLNSVSDVSDISGNVDIVSQ